MKVNIQLPKVFKIKESDSISTIIDMQLDLKKTIRKFQNLDKAVTELIKEKRSKEKRMEN